MTDPERVTQDVYIGVDLGTTAVKVAAFTADGQQVALSGHEYPLEVPQPGAAEQDPDLILHATLRALREVVERVGAGRVQAVGWAAAMHSVLPVDQDGRPLMHALTWADQRPTRVAETIRRDEWGLSIYRRTGTPPYAMSPLAKLRWLHEERPEVARAAARFVSVKEYVHHRLHGEWAVDHSMASATGLFDLMRRDWDPEALERARVSPARLSPLVPTTWRLPPLTPGASRETGLRPDTPCFIGANDGALANLGSGAVRPGVAAITLGTSGAVRVAADRPTTEPSGRTFCYALTEDRWVVGGPVNNGAVVLRWVRDNFAPLDASAARAAGREPYEALSDLAASVPAGAEGLLFLPYLLGERAPLWSSGARGAFLGVSFEHRREHFVRAAMEGVILNLALVVRILQDRVYEPSAYQASGGFARSPLWRQILADVLGRDINYPETFEATAHGAALLARHAHGDLPDLTDAERLVGSVALHRPDRAAHAVYAELLPLFEELSGKLLDDSRALAAFQRRQG